LSERVEGIAPAAVLESPFDGLTHPGASGQATALGRLADSAIQRVWYEDLQAMTHILILT